MNPARNTMGKILLTGAAGLALAALTLLAPWSAAAPAAIDQAKALPTATVAAPTAPATDAARQPVAIAAEGSGFYSAPAGQRMRFAYRVESGTRLGRDETTAGQGMTVELEGEMTLLVLARRQDELVVELRLPPTAARTRSEQGEQAHGADAAIRRDLGQPALVRMRDDGTTLGYAFAEDVLPENRNCVRAIWSALRAVLRDDGGRPWRSTEADTVGDALLEYRWREPFVQDGAIRGGIVERRKLGYAGRAASGRGALGVTGEGIAHCNPSLGWTERVWWREQSSQAIEELGCIARSVLEASCELLEVGWQEPAAGDVWHTAWLPVDGSAERPSDAATRIARQYEQKLSGVTADDLLAQLGELIRSGRCPSQEAWNLKVDLTWMIRLRPETLGHLQALLPTLDPDLAGLVLSAAGAAEVAAAQDWLTRLLADPVADAGLRRSAALALFQVRQPTPALLAAVSANVTGDAPASLVRDTGELLLGALIARAGGAAPAGAIEALLGLEARAVRQGGLVNWLEALGNAARPEALDPARRHLADAAPAVRIAAVSALRGIPGEAADAALIAVLADRDADVRGRSGEALATRDGPLALAAVTRLLLSEPDAEVRRVTTAAVAGRARTEPDVAALLQRLAASDAAEEVRRLAREALELR